MRTSWLTAPAAEGAEGELDTHLLHDTVTAVAEERVGNFVSHNGGDAIVVGGDREDATIESDFAARHNKGVHLVLPDDIDVPFEALGTAKDKVLLAVRNPFVHADRLDDPLGDALHLCKLGIVFWDGTFPDERGVFLVCSGFELGVEKRRRDAADEAHALVEGSHDRATDPTATGSATAVEQEEGG